MDEATSNNTPFAEPENRIYKRDRRIRCARYHITAFMLYGAHFVPYSFPLYPVIALGKRMADRAPRVATLLIWAVYVAGIFAYTNSSYFFRYSYILCTNPLFFWVSAIAGIWAAAAAAAGRYPAAYTPFIVLAVLNTILPNSHPFAHRFAYEPGKHIALLLLSVILVHLKIGMKRGWPLPFLLAVALLHTGNNALPLVAALCSFISVITGLKSGIMNRFNPIVHGFSVFHLLLFLGLSQFYSNSLPRAIDKKTPPESVTPIHIYGSRANDIPRLAGNDNRFLSADKSGEYLLFGTRMTRPDLFRISRSDPSDVKSMKIENTSDNIILSSDGKYFVTGSFGRQTLEKIEIEHFSIEKTVKLPYTPIRLAFDPLRDEIFTISEFSGGALFIYDLDTMEMKRKFIRSPEDRNFRDFAVDSTARRIVIIQWLDLVLYDSETFEELSRVRTSNRGLGRLAIDPDSKTVYLTHTHSGKLLSFGYDNDNFEKLAEYDLGFGIRDIDYDPVYHRIAAANYFSGVLTLFDIDRGKTVFRIGLGNRMRHIEFTVNGREILTTTMAGGFIIDTELAFLESALDNRQAQPPFLETVLSAVRMTFPPAFFSFKHIGGIQ